MNDYIIRYRVTEEKSGLKEQYTNAVYIQSDSLENAKTTIQNCYVDTVDITYTIQFL